jgi:hypothetical protein
MARRPDADQSIASSGHLNVSVSNLQLRPFLAFVRLVRMPQDQQFGITVLFNFVVSVNFILLSTEFIIYVSLWCQKYSLKQVTEIPQYFNKTAVNYLNGVCDCT